MLYKRPTKIIIKLKNLVNNLKIVKQIIGKDKGICAIVKANAYGHGNVEIAKTLNKEGINFFGVASAYEALKLFKNNISGKILSLGKIYKEDLDLARKFPYVVTISSLNDLELLENVDFKLNINVKFDTGMGRCGILPDEEKIFIEKIRANKNLILEGVLTHFPAADNDKSFTDYQINCFNKIKEIFYENGFKDLYFHCANSDAIINKNTSYFDIVRPGIILYGSYWDIEKKRILGLKPVMEFVSKVVDIKDFKKGFTIGYGRTFQVTGESMKCALIPVGYADGFSRYFSNKGNVLINNKLCKILGRVSMDWIVTEAYENTKIGDNVVIFGDNKGILDIDEIASSIDTISYEILCNVGGNFRKEVVYDKSS